MFVCGVCCGKYDCSEVEVGMTCVCMWCVCGVVSMIAARWK